MSSNRKHHHFSLAWSLPVVVAIMFLVVAKLAALQRADVIQELDNRVLHGSTDDAKDAVRNLAEIPRPPLALLVKAATSPNLDVAREAQQAIDDYLKTCQRQLKAGRNVKLVGRQLTVLADALAIEQHLFSVVDFPWVEKTTRKILQLANRIPSQTTPLVAARCDKILAAVAAGASAANKPATTSSVASQKAPGGNSDPAGAGSGLALGTATNWTDLRQSERLAKLAAQPWGEVAVAADNAGTRLLPITLQMPDTGMPYSDIGFEGDAPAGVLPDGPSESGWKAQWMHPILRSLPTVPRGAAPQPRHAADSTTDESHAGLGEEPRRFHANDEWFEGVESRKLLARWLVAEGPDVYPLEQELMDRGFGRVSPRLVKQLFSEQVEDRLRLVDDVLTDPGIDARPWLLLLADDAEGDVRLVAVTIMATSRDPVLIEKAWQVAIRDRDPRVAGLAERLRERRGGGRAELNRKRLR
ncbi:MAG: hypothetical protein WD468_10105 [Pirellulales bacterium]